MKLVNISKVYHNKNNTVEALKDINLDLSENGLIVLLGASGCGKTTLLNIISGKDKNYKGELSDVPFFDYLTQEFNLLEAMSVYDNLFCVSEDKTLIDHYLKIYDMKIHKDKKVGNLSNGQKKRVQFIRSLLYKPGLLLCDEPTAALDFENADILMQQLKTISKEMQVILVTHDIKLAEKYGDRIIHMDQGIIIEDTKDNIITTPIKVGSKVSKKSFNKTLWLVLKELKTRLFENILFIVLSVCIVFSIFTTFNLFDTVDTQTKYMADFKNTRNLVISLPNQTEFPRTNNLYDAVYIKFQQHDYHSLQDLIAKNHEIIAVEAYYSSQFGNGTGVVVDKEELDDLPFNEVKCMVFTEVLENMDDYIDTGVCSTKYSILKIPMELPVIMPYDEKIRERYFKESKEKTVLDYMVNAFDLVNDYQELPLLFGSLPKNSDEIVLSLSTANYLMEIGAPYQTIEELIGQHLEMGTSSLANQVRNTTEPPYRLHSLKIVGISAVENDYMKMIFFNSGFGNNPLLRYYVRDDENLYFNYVRFLLKPGSNYEKVVASLNEQYPSADNTMVLYSGAGLGNNRIVARYKNPANFMVFAVGIIGILSGLVALLYFFQRHRFKKEHHIFATYGYQNYLEMFIRVLIINTSATIIALVSCSFFCDIVNKSAANYHYEKLVTFSIGAVLLSAVVTTLFYFLMEGIILSRLDKHD